MTLKSVKDYEITVPPYDEDQFIVITPSGTCTEALNKELFDIVKNHFESDGIKKFLLDMSKVVTINSDFLAKIMELSLIIRPYQGRFAYYNPLPVVAEILQKTGSVYVFRVYGKHQRNQAELYLKMPIDVLRDLSKQIGYEEESPTSLMEVSAQVIERLANKSGT